MELPSRDEASEVVNDDFEVQSTSLETVIPEKAGAVNNNLETPSTSLAPSEADSTQPTTPSSAVVQAALRPQAPPITKSPKHMAVPSLPIIPAIPQVSFTPRTVKQPSISISSEAVKARDLSNGEQNSIAVETAAQSNERDSPRNSESGPISSSPPPPKLAPKSWADLVRQSNNKAKPGAKEKNTTQPNGLTTSTTGSLPEALFSYNVDEADDDTKISFLEPRGLVNTGNMCYMNSVRLITHGIHRILVYKLIFCNRFYKYSFSAFHFTTFLIKWVNKLFIISKVKLRY